MKRLLHVVFAALGLAFVTGCGSTQYKFIPMLPDASFRAFSSEAVETSERPDFPYIVLGEIYVTPSQDSNLIRELTGQSITPEELTSREAAKAGATHWIRSMRSISADFTINERTYHAEEFVVIAIRKVDGTGGDVRTAGSSVYDYIDSLHMAAKPMLNKRTRAELRAFISRIDSLTRNDIEGFFGDPQQTIVKEGKMKYNYATQFSNVHGYNGEETFSIWTRFDGDRATDLTFSLIPHQLLKRDKLVSK